jgi:hypothetical protein
LAIDETIVEVLGVDALHSIYTRLRDEHSVTRDELPYRIETLYNVLENSFEVFGAKTLGTVIAEKFYAALGLTFYNHDCYSLSDYVQYAKSKFNES